MKVRSNEIELHVEQRGAGAPALVFLHYWGGSSRTWRHVVEALAPEFRTVTIDQRGWGQSDKPETGYTLADLADDAQSVIAALQLEQYILVGHSMGGKVAQLIASRRPEGLVGLALIAPAAPTPLAIPEEVRTGMVQAYATRDSIVATVRQVLAPHGLAPDDLELVIADSLVGGNAAKAAWPLVASQEDITAAVAHIDVPVIVVSGEDDRVDPPAVLRSDLLTHIPQAQLLVLPGVGHLSPLEAPTDIADILRAIAPLVIGSSPGSTARDEASEPRRCTWCGMSLKAAAERRLGRFSDTSS
ncbi:alpha/beta hydrolase [Allorhizobium sp. BGMRC 0089]|uniref:alpha/beta fold hydrolase n=1 Tax=Allorhizobium sonneratiae TaxID=2934936 RepID=UPI00203458B8|nr:alpha/beta hydrolase [Allorhizobium sonneratiae]MCM2292546.1 alpha/beta hydrolase [Allorhizobium sonneratiae]